MSEKRLRLYILALIFSALIFSVLPASAITKVEKITYRGWVDSYRLTSGAFSIVVVPEIGGRIMEYSVNGKNVIWENSEEFGQAYPVSKEWHNYGGHKTWIAFKDKRVWPPDPLLDFGKASVEVLKGSSGKIVLRIYGAASLKSGVTFTKEISMHDSGEVRITHRMHNISPHNVSYSIWNVTQVDSPQYIVFPINKHSKFPQGVTDLESIPRKKGQVQLKDGLCIIRFTRDSCKLGSDTDGKWMLMLRDNLAYMKTFSPIINGAKYPDGGCCVEIYADPTYPYMEMELLGPVLNLRPGEHSELEEKWHLFELIQPVSCENSITESINQLRKKGFLF